MDLNRRADGPNTDDAAEVLCWMKCAPPRHVTGSEYPHECYKCFYPDGSVSKMIERSAVGNISGIVYRGVHNRPVITLPADVLRVLNDTLLETEERHGRAGDAHGAQGENSESRKRKSREIVHNTSMDVFESEALHENAFHHRETLKLILLKARLKHLQ